MEMESSEGAPLPNATHPSPQKNKAFCLALFNHYMGGISMSIPWNSHGSIAVSGSLNRW